MSAQILSDPSVTNGFLFLFAFEEKTLHKLGEIKLVAVLNVDRVSVESIAN